MCECKRERERDRERKFGLGIEFCYDFEVWTEMEEDGEETEENVDFLWEKTATRISTFDKNDSSLDSEPPFFLFSLKDDL